MSVLRKVTIVAPFFNEEETIALFLTRVRSVLFSVQAESQIILVNDGSSDSSLRRIDELKISAASIKIVNLSRNFGHQAAIAAGLAAADGDAVIIMDTDLQDPPELIPELIQTFEKGYDIIHVVRKSRSATFLMRSIYKLFYSLLRFSTATEIPAESGDFCLLSRRVVDLLKALPEVHLFHRGLRAWLGFKATTLQIDRPARAAGTPKYSAIKLCRLAADGIFSFSSMPLRIVSVCGVIAVAMSVLFCLYALFARFYWTVVPSGFTATIFVITFLAGLQLLSLGIVGEYVGRIYEQVKQRPKYIVSEITSLNNSESRETQY